MHTLLEKQLSKTRLSKNKIPDIKNWQEFLDKVDSTYSKFDSDICTQDKSLSKFAVNKDILYQQLKISAESRHSAVLKAFPDLIFLVDEDGLCLQILAENKMDLVMTEKQIIGKTFTEILPPGKAEIFMDCIKKTLKNNATQSIEYELTVLGGKQNFEGRVIPASYSVDGKKTVLFLARNITNQHKSDRQQKLLNSVMASATEGIVIVRSDKKVLYVNSAIEKMTGFDEAELLNQGRGFLRHELDQILCDDLCAQAHSCDHFQRQIVIHSKTGDETEVLLSMDTIRDEQGEIEYFVGMLTDINEIKLSHKRLQHLATHDVLTELPNRIMFEERVSQVVSRSLRNSEMAAVFFLDLDRFKTINDSLGHSVGDKLLIDVAKRLQLVCRAEDTVARFGGDEFVILVENIKKPKAVTQFAKKILGVFNPGFIVQGNEFVVSTSIGIALFPPHGSDSEELIKHADAAMYVAKNLGRNRYQMFADEYLESAVAGLKLEYEIQNALNKNEFILYYQPQYDLVENSISGFEALIRWSHPEHGIIEPNKFIQVAESTGQIAEIGLWVFTEMCRKIVEWTQQKIPFKQVSFNLSQRQLMDVKLAEKLITIMTYTGALDYADKIECEITESLIIKQMDLAYSTISQLKKAGLKMAIDDFGTGHSSLVNLKRFPLDRLKIDIEFVRDIGKDQNDEAIIKATVALAEGFGLTVVAEGVENYLQLEFLKSVGCHQVQGYLYNKPMSAEDVQKLFDHPLEVMT